jgi:hypothetical protein
MGGMNLLGEILAAMSQNNFSYMRQKARQEKEANAMFVWTYQQNQQSSSSVFLSQQTSEQCFQHNKPAKRTGRKSRCTCMHPIKWGPV